MPTSTPPAATFFVDAHVHVYPCFDRRRFMDSILTNVRRAAERAGVRNAAPPVVVLVDKAHTHHFRRFRDGAEPVAEGWTVRRTDEDASIIASRGPGDEVLIIAGRQIATSDVLEALALSVDAEFPEGRPLRKTLEAVLDAGAIAVMPWGFGKWWFRRGGLIREILASPLGTRVFVGDNGSRPRGLPRSSIFAEARERGIWSLPGTDPLSFPWDASRPGSFGFVLNGEISRSTPARDFKRLIHGLDRQPPLYGTAESVLRCVAHQSALQVRKRVLQLTGRRPTDGSRRQRRATPT